jgi:hypothetical protein
MLVLEIGLEVEQDNWLAAILHIFDAVYPCVSGDIAKYFQTWVARIPGAAIALGCFCNYKRACKSFFLYSRTHGASIRTKCISYATKNASFNTINWLPLEVIYFWARYNFSVETNTLCHKTKIPQKWYLVWLGMRDSNPRSWDQNPVPYRLANPQPSRIPAPKRQNWHENWPGSYAV